MLNPVAVSELAPVKPVSMSEFKSATKPSEAVSQKISNKDSTGSVSYIAKYGCIVADNEPIAFVVDSLAINGFVSN